MSMLIMNINFDVQNLQKCMLVCEGTKCILCSFVSDTCHCVKVTTNTTAHNNIIIRVLYYMFSGKSKRKLNVVWDVYIIFMFLSHSLFIACL